MFNPTAVVIDAFVDELHKGYISTYSNLEPDYPGIIDYVGHMALELIANSDAPYHDLGHTICVTLLGQEVLKGKHLREGGASPAFRALDAWQPGNAGKCSPSPTYPPALLQPR